MGDKEGDARVQIVITLFFICILAGGVFLSMFTFLPETESTDWYFLLGVALEAIPWVFWLFTYLYTCLRPRGGSDYALNGCHGPCPAQPSPATSNDGAAISAAPDEIQSMPVHSPSRDDQRHVHFGSVIVVGEEDDLNSEVNHRRGGGSGSTSTSTYTSVGSKESEIPLTLGTSACLSK